MKKLILLAAAIAAHAACAWTVEKHIDEMTDARTYIIWTTGTVVQVNSLVSYVPQLQFRIRPVTWYAMLNQLKFSCEAAFAIETEGFTRNGVPVMLRLDDEKPYSETWNPSTDRRVAFSPTPQPFLALAREKKMLRIRYGTTLGDIRTTRFELAGLDGAIAELKRQVAKDPPKD